QLPGYRARPAFGALCRSLEDRDFGVRAQARTALRTSDPEPEDILPILKRSLDDKGDVAGRAWAVVWVGEIATGSNEPQTREAVALLSAALTDGEAAIRREAALALGTVGAEARPALGRLRDRVGDSDSAVRLQAAIALGRIDPQAARDAIPVLIEALPANP